LDQSIDAGPESDAVDISACYRCGRRLTRGWSFFFRASPAQARRQIGFQGSEATKCLQCALLHLHLHLLRRSLKVAAVVGTILTLLNQGDIILAGQWDSALY
jgi:hypothetical protein